MASFDQNVPQMIDEMFEALKAFTTDGTCDKCDCCFNWHITYHIGIIGRISDSASERAFDALCAFQTALKSHKCRDESYPPAALFLMRGHSQGPFWCHVLYQKVNDLIGVMKPLQQKQNKRQREE